jgi:hypothetical protein
MSAIPTLAGCSSARRPPWVRGARRIAAAAARALILASLVHATVASAGDLSPSVPAFRPDFPVFGGGKFVNIFDSDAALTNASAHVAWSLAVPLLGQRLGGRRGLWVSGLSWIALSFTQEALFHAPPNPGRGYPAEVRADLLTRIVPCASLLVWDRGRGGRPPAAPRMVPADGLPGLSSDLLPPDRADQLLREAALRMPGLGSRIQADPGPGPAGDGPSAAATPSVRPPADARGPPAVLTWEQGDGSTPGRPADAATGAR